MPHLRSIGWKEGPPDGNGGFPFDVPAIRTLPTLELSPSVTLLVGENGSGKSTLLEAIALAARLPTVGAEESGTDEKFVPGGLHLLDEPEAALSPQSQLGMLALLLDMVTKGAQFIIATHSPMLVAYPDAFIYSFDRLPVARVAYQELDHVRLTRDFLADPARFLRKLRD